MPQGGVLSISTENVSIGGVGTTFRLYFPRASTNEQKHAKGRARPAELGSETVLLVEDEAEVREVAQRLLELAGYTVLTADAPEAEKRVWAEHADRIAMVISDVVMPEGTGHELAAALRAARPDLPVLFITGHDPNLGNGSDDPTLPKPFTRDELLSYVRRTLDDQATRSVPPRRSHP